MNSILLNRVLLITCLVLSFHFNVLAQTDASSQYAGDLSVWKGFDRYTFQFQGREAFITTPKTSLDGNPWVWNARFPNWHVEMDSILVSQGFHIAHINTNNLYGSPEAMKVWDAFYEYVTTKFNFNTKVSLEGVSRGGLFVYNWAKDNPEKIHCIYAESPVCDFKSWPAGFGDGLGSSEDWETLKRVYGFESDQKARAYMNNPIDGLASLAKAKVPILHMVGLNDKVVPANENTLVLVDRYIKLGGPATVVPCTQGPQNLNGHHFSIETPQFAADFIKYHSHQLPKKLISSDYHKIRSGLKNSLIQFEKRKRGRVAFLGGSITYNGGWRDSICNYLQNRFPKTQFEFIAAGISSMGTTPGAFRMERDILSKGSIDLLFEEAAVNDATNGRTSDEQIQAMEGIVRHAKIANPAIDIVMMHFVDPQKMEIYRNGGVPEVIKNHNAVAEHYRIPTLNLAKEVTDRIDHEEFSWLEDFKNLHPSPFGQGIYAHSMIEFMDNAYSAHLDDDDKIIARPLPDKLNIASYDEGELIDISFAKKLKGWHIQSAWVPKDGTGTRSNYTNVPMLISEQPGSSLQFKFSGNAVGIAVAAGQDAGNIEYRVDSGEWKKLTLFTQWRKHLHLPWYYTLASGLKSGKHVLKIRISDDKSEQSSGNACRIRYFFINNS